MEKRRSLFRSYLWAGLFLSTSLFAQRTYWPVHPSGLAATSHTHVSVSGRVTLVKKEADGDLHIRIADALGNFVVGECIPAMPCVAPSVGDYVMAQGISRWDGEHSWPEINPIEKLIILKAK